MHSTATRLASKGKGFAKSIKFAKAISGGIAANLGQALMTSLGGRSEDLKYEDMMAFADLYTAVPSMRREADKASCLPALSRAPARSAKDSLSSFEDDLSFAGSSLGEDGGAMLGGEPPIKVHLPVEPQS